MTPKAKADELIDEIYNLHLQNNTERTDFDRAFKYGIECAVDEILNLIEGFDLELTYNYYKEVKKEIEKL